MSCFILQLLHQVYYFSFYKLSLMIYAELEQ